MSDSSEKFDDASWHEDDAANLGQAAIHIALVYCWLRSRGLLSEKDLPEKWQEKLESESITPSEFFESWSDNKLLASEMQQDAANFLAVFYSKKYLPAIQNRKIPGLQFDPRYKVPYDIGDTWNNLEPVAIYLNKQYGLWKKLRFFRRVR
jgi:hypothetical protein